MTTFIFQSPAKQRISFSHNVEASRHENKLTAIFFFLRGIDDVKVSCSLERVECHHGQQHYYVYPLYPDPQPCVFIAFIGVGNSLPFHSPQYQIVTCHNTKLNCEKRWKIVTHLILLPAIFVVWLKVVMPVSVRRTERVLSKTRMSLSALHKRLEKYHWQYSHCSLKDKIPIILIC